MTDPATPPFTPPPDWTTTDAAEWARQFVHHVKLDQRLPLDWGAMIGWFNRAILAGAAYAAADRAPRSFDPDDRGTWPRSEEQALTLDAGRWRIATFLDADPPYWAVPDGTATAVCAAADGDLWLPLPPTPHEGS